MKRIKHYIFFVYGIFLVCLSSCRDDMALEVPGYVPEGEPAMITVTLSIPDMTQMTRAAGVSPDEAWRVTSLWIGVYSVTSGKRIGQRYLPAENFIFSNHNPREIRIEKISVNSGKARLVAVANCDYTGGVKISSGETESTLMNLLTNDGGATWDSFCELAAVLPTSNDVMRGSRSSFVMSGYCTSQHDGNHLGPENIVDIWPDRNTEDNPDYIIYLRRLDSYVKFNITTEQNVIFTPISWQVCNLPGVSYIHERFSGDPSTLNAADQNVKADNLWDGDDAGNVSYYHNTLVYGASYFDLEVIDNNNKYSFDFYQYENKHTGVWTQNDEEVKKVTGTNLYDSNYHLREIEHKNEDGSNSGWYKGLVREPKSGDSPSSGEGWNNNATYVVIKGTVDYWYDPNNNKPVAEEAEGAIHRIADVIYTVHLGYCEGEGLAKVNDFNCRRNTKYTYNITIGGAEKIKLEATNEGEKQPGVEGTVTDMNNVLIDLDSHYGVFNIALSDKERAELKWRIMTTYGEEVIDIIGGYDDGNTFTTAAYDVRGKRNANMRSSLPDNQFYNWIQIRPTTGENIIAEYPGDPRLIRRSDTNSEYITRDIKSYASLENDGSGIWYLDQLADPYHYINNNGQSQVNENGITELGDEKKWYTVFIDEYVWEFQYNKNNNSLTGDPLILSEWGQYVNNPPRRVWIALSNMNISPDGESIYSNGQYLVSQESIQTYYSDNARNGLGIEDTNESYIGDQTWYWENFNSNTYSSIDGLFNQYKYCQDSNHDEWSEVINSKTFKIGKRHQIGKGKETDLTGIHYYIPDHEPYYMRACMARNRDLNGNGKIEPNEIRWYLPTARTYTRIVLGTPSLRSPLLKLQDYPQEDIITAGKGDIYTHYASSDKQMLWAEEFAAIGNLNTATAQTLRCIRNIGQETNLELVKTSSEYETIVLPYEKRTGKQIIDLLYYKPEAVRPYQAGVIGPHFVGDELSYASTHFQYAKEDCTSLNIFNATEIDGDVKVDNSGVTIGSTGIIKNIVESSRENWTTVIDENLICSKYSEENYGSDKGTWRTPNITEMAILVFLDDRYYSSNFNPQYEGILGKDTTDKATRRYLTSSREFFKGEGNRFMKAERFNGKNENYIGQPLVTANDKGKEHYLRCVKDVR